MQIYIQFCRNYRPYERVCDSEFCQLFHLQIKHFLIPIHSHNKGCDSLRTQTYFQSSHLFILKVNWIGRNAPQLKLRLGSQARGGTYIWRFILEAFYRLGLNRGNTVLFLFSRCSRTNRPLSVKRCVHFKRHDGKSASWNYLKCTVRRRTGWDLSRLVPVLGSF